MSHVATTLGHDELNFYEYRCRELVGKWGLDETTAHRKAYAEMLHRYLPPDSPVLAYYPCASKGFHVVLSS